MKLHRGGGPVINQGQSGYKHRAQSKNSQVNIVTRMNKCSVPEQAIRGITQGGYIALHKQDVDEVLHSIA